MVLNFPEYHILGTTTFLLDLLLLLNNTNLTSSVSFCGLIIHFIFGLTHAPFSSHLSSCIHAPAERYLVWFHIMPMINKTTVRRHKQVFHRWNFQLLCWDTKEHQLWVIRKEYTYKKLPRFFQCGCTILHFHQQRGFPLHPNVSSIMCFQWRVFGILIVVYWYVF